MASVGLPLVDGGFDLYLRRLLTLFVRPLQVKARSFLGPDGQFEVGVSSLHLDPKGYVVLPYIPPPGWQLTGNLWAIPIPDFVHIAQHDGKGYIFSSYFGRAVRGPESAFLVEVDKLYSQWIAKIPGWKRPVREAEFPGPMEEVPMAATRALGKSGELWLASELMRRGLNDVVIAQDRLRLDCVSMLLHDLRSFRVGGLAVHTSTINSSGHIQFQIHRQTFFVDPSLMVVVLVYQDDGMLHDISFVIPSPDLAKVATPSVSRGYATYHGYHRLSPLALKLRPYAVPTEKLAAVILSRVGGAIPS